ncbi:hypothetical protein [Ammoniphilus resinae]|uniref:IrrE N-terminal-like domain-containing protein n=1 Tax=Ammoniphilus resinae TaxID=861532 RepID=A0ABS4GNV4_9BACL|nr:hypothetical protein [Ammoniphilus resinae]MBP1931950.1 hypothetical protein [Ammoniphilus resinae]
MSLDDLHYEVEQLRGEPASIIFVGDENDYGLNPTQPAAIDSDDNIIVLNSLLDDVKEQCIAHELGHMWLKYSGLIEVRYPFSYEFRTPEQYLALEINNTISHIWVIELLRDRFGISSDYHLNQRKAIIQHVQDIEGLDSFQLHGMGIALFDYERTYPNSTPEVQVVLQRCDKSIKSAYEAAKTHLTYRVSTTSYDKQKIAIHNLLAELGYPPTLFRIVHNK